MLTNHNRQPYRTTGPGVWGTGVCMEARLWVQAEAPTGRTGQPQGTSADRRTDHRT